MRKINKYHLSLLLLLLTAASFSQKRTYSPFSRYGVGELNATGYGQNAAMGNTGIGLKSNSHLNILNPASYSAIDSMSFYFEAGITGYTQTFKAGPEKEKYNNIDFSYFAMGFPITRKIHTSWGLRPFSNSGYKFEFSDETTLNRAIGTGNLTSAYGGLSYAPAPNLSLGIHGTYLFGNIQHTSFVEFLNDANAYKHGLQTKIHTSDFFFDVGAQYSAPVSEGETLTIGVTFRPQTSISGNFSRILARGSRYGEEGTLFTTNDTISSNTSGIRGFDLPRSLGFGISYSRDDQWLIAADYSLSNWGEISLPDDYSNTTNSQHISAGAQFIPDAGSRNYLDRMQYRAGIKYNEEYVKINNQQINDFGITFGMGLPYGRSKTSVNLAFEIGRRQPDGDLNMTENYSKITVNFTFHEFWFMQRKFD